jgi:hypothetical protein
LDGFRKVLFDHLDQEVGTRLTRCSEPLTKLWQVLDLKAANMKKYWSLEEVDRLVMYVFAVLCTSLYSTAVFQIMLSATPRL